MIRAVLQTGSTSVSGGVSDPTSSCPPADVAASEFYSRLERNHARAAVAAQPDAEQAGGRRGRIGECSKARLGGGLTWNTGEDHGGQAKIRVVEDIEELSVKSQFYPLSEWKPFGHVEVAPEEIGTAQCITAEIAELAILRGVAAQAGPGAGSTAETNALGLSH